MLAWLLGRLLEMFAGFLLKMLQPILNGSTVLTLLAIAKALFLAGGKA